MGNIVLLDELTINQIAAGEVIERPASVIKEMIENSIDAGATNITVEIKNGGISFIRITDNGKGIAKDDIELAFERHATSKIRSAFDLSTVKSMGFRGEALASISAIANVELTSRTENDEIGTRIVVEGGNTLSIDEIGCSKGTTITVRNLFFNTPVRYKFLKKDFTESGYIEDVITRIALIHPEIAIKFINTGKIVIQTNGNGDINSVIYAIFGKEVAGNIMPVNYDYEDISIKGVIGKASIARGNRSNQIFFVNKRYVKDKTLTSAVDQAYKGMLPMGKFGFLVLNIEMLPSKVDVNVHPAKLEVRFAEENVIFKAMYHAVKDTLEKQDIVSDKEIIGQIKEARENSFKIKDAQEIMEKTYTLQNETKEQESLKSENVEDKQFTPILEMEKIKANTDVFESLKKLQEELRQEVEQNPNIQLTDKYKSMEQQYNQIIKPIFEEKEENEKDETVKDEQKVEEIIKEDEIQREIENEEKIQKEAENKEEKIIPIVFEDSKVSEEQKEEQFDKQRDLINEEKSQESFENNQEVEIENSKIENENIQEIENDTTQEKETNVNMENQKIENIEFDFELPPKDIASSEYIEPKVQENQEEIEKEKEDSKSKMPSFEEMYRQLFGKEPYGGRRPVEPEIKKEEPKSQENFYTIDTNMEDSNVSMFEGDTSYSKAQYKFIGTAFNTYIILQIENELLLVDEHLAHEKIMYEKVKSNFYSQGEKASQMLLLPDIITLSHKEMEIAKDNFELFEKAGFVLEEFGENTIKLSGVPDVCVDLDTANLFKQTLDQIDTVARNAQNEKEEKFIIAIANKAAIKSNTVLNPEEIDSLLEKLLSLSNPFTCPDGRSMAIRMTKYEIERKFARK